MYTIDTERSSTIVNISSTYITKNAQRGNIIKNSNNSCLLSKASQRSYQKSKPTMHEKLAHTLGSLFITHTFHVCKKIFLLQRILVFHEYPNLWVHIVHIIMTKSIHDELLNNKQWQDYLFLCRWPFRNSPMNLLWSSTCCLVHNNNSRNKINILWFEIFN